MRRSIAALVLAAASLVPAIAAADVLTAPLGRAVIGGLGIGTVSTLLFVPVVFAVVHTLLARRRARYAEATATPQVQ